MSEETMQFEEAMNQLEQVVKQLETGDVPLEDAIELYKQGMQLSAFCQHKLQHAEEQFMTMMNDQDEEQVYEIKGGDEQNGK